MEVSKRGIKLYRFQPYGEVHKTELRAAKICNDKLWLSTRANLNDPMDVDHHVSDFTQDSTGEITALMSLAKVAYYDQDAAYRNFNFVKTFVDTTLLNSIQDWVARGGNSIDLCDAYRERFSRVGIACFTPNWDSPPMWAHYAQEGKGFVMEYHVNQMELVERAGTAIDCDWVTYVERSRNISLSELLFSPHEAAVRYLYTKMLPWSYEKEWRLVNFEGGDLNVALPTGMTLTKIILGLNSPDDQIRCLTEKAKEWNNVTVEKALIQQDRTFALSTFR
jgi:Protein of unknown function (DUF2971)